MLKTQLGDVVLRHASGPNSPAGLTDPAWTSEPDCTEPVHRLDRVTHSLARWL